MSEGKVEVKIEELKSKLECSICFSVYNRPCTLACGHTFCQDCWKKWFDQKSLAFHGQQASCPNCRTMNKKEQSINFVIRDLIESVPALVSIFNFEYQGIDLSGSVSGPCDLICSQGNKVLKTKLAFAKISELLSSVFSDVHVDTFFFVDEKTIDLSKVTPRLIEHYQSTNLLEIVFSWMNHFRGKEVMNAVESVWVTEFFSKFGVKLLEELVTISCYFNIPLLVTCAVRKLFSLTPTPRISTSLHYLRDRTP
jgi:hypothetical protein